MENIKTVSFETALLAKSKGYNIPTKECYHFGIRRTLSWIKQNKYFYTQCIFLPSIFYLQKWVKEIYGIEVIPTIKFIKNQKKYGYELYNDKLKLEEIDIPSLDDMEKAIEIGIKNALKRV